jgi:hypothetical protein
LDLSPETLDYLNGRASNYGGTSADILRITPSILDTDTELMNFWENHDLSHIQSQANSPELANNWSNIIPEDPVLNQARGELDMTLGEQLNAQMDNWIDASYIDLADPSGDDPLF